MSGEDSLDVALEGRSDNFKQKVIDVVRRSGINTKDPLFLVLASLGKFEVLMEEMPGKLDTVVESWTVEIDDKLDKAASVALVQQKSAIAKAAQTLLNKVEKQKTKVIFSSVLPTTLILSGVFCIGIFIGYIIPIWKGRNSIEPATLTAQEKETLKWALSKEGQFAKNIIKWNSFDLNVCRSKTEKLKGKCVIWVVPDNRRSRGK
jgi:hypothetical protein